MVFARVATWATSRVDPWVDCLVLEMAVAWVARKVLSMVVALVVWKVVRMDA